MVCTNLLLTPKEDYVWKLRHRIHMLCTVQCNRLLYLIICREEKVNSLNTANSSSDFSSDCELCWLSDEWWVIIDIRYHQSSFIMAYAGASSHRHPSGQVARPRNHLLVDQSSLFLERLKESPSIFNGKPKNIQVLSTSWGESPHLLATLYYWTLGPPSIFDLGLMIDDWGQK